MQILDNVLYLAFMVGILQLLDIFVFKQGGLTFNQLWWAVGGCFVGAGLTIAVRSLL